MRISNSATFAALFLLVLAIAWATPAMSQQSHSAHGGTQASPAHGFGLTPEQSAAAQKIYATQGRQIWTLHQLLKARNMELDALSASETPDQARIKALIKDITGLTEQLLQSEVDMRQQLAKAGVPVWGGRGMGGMMGGGMMGGGMMGGGGCPMMSGGGGHGGHGAGQPQPSSAPAAGGQ